MPMATEEGSAVARPDERLASDAIACAPATELSIALRTDTGQAARGAPPPFAPDAASVRLPDI